MTRLAIAATALALACGGSYALGATSPPTARPASDASIVNAINRLDSDVRAEKKDLHNTISDTCRALAQSPGDCPFHAL